MSLAQTIRSLRLLAALGPVVFGLSSHAAAHGAEPPAQPAKPAGKDAIAEMKSTSLESWDTIKDYPHEKRDEFAAVVRRMSAKLDADIREMNAKVGTLSDDNAKKREDALKDFSDDRSYLETLLSNLHTGTSDTWDNAKAKVGDAWQSLQAAYEKVKASPTS